LPDGTVNATLEDDTDVGSRLVGSVVVVVVLVA
jgi:hypothetical protein